MKSWQLSGSSSYWPHGYAKASGYNLCLHAGNILVRKAASGAHELVPIDHGYVLPDTFQDISFEWLYWPQARAPFGERAQFIVCSETCSNMACPPHFLGPWLHRT